ncbi:MAG: hypothetical protein GY950_34785 [bacterium]|nr:hypothetical protein [bacterium]
MQDINYSIRFLEEAMSKPPQKILTAAIAMENNHNTDIWLFIPQYLFEDINPDDIRIKCLELRKRENEKPYMKVFGNQTLNIFKLQPGQKLELHNWQFISRDHLVDGMIFITENISFTPENEFSEIVSKGQIIIPDQIPNEAALLKCIYAAGDSRLDLLDTPFVIDFSLKNNGGNES